MDILKQKHVLYINSIWIKRLNSLVISNIICLNYVFRSSQWLPKEVM